MLFVVCLPYKHAKVRNFMRPAKLFAWILPQARQKVEFWQPRMTMYDIISYLCSPNG